MPGRLKSVETSLPNNLFIGSPRAPSILGVRTACLCGSPQVLCLLGAGLALDPHGG